jgi:hypothetical protein
MNIPQLFKKLTHPVAVRYVRDFSTHITATGLRIHTPHGFVLSSAQLAEIEAACLTDKSKFIPFNVNKFREWASRLKEQQEVAFKEIKDPGNNYKK